jgi:hypothetical protein
VTADRGSLSCDPDHSRTTGSSIPDRELLPLRLPLTLMEMALEAPSEFKSEVNRASGSKIVMGHWPIESSNLSLYASLSERGSPGMPVHTAGFGFTLRTVSPIESATDAIRCRLRLGGWLLEHLTRWEPGSSE